MVAEEVVISLSGGAPWGFRLQGGAEQQKPLQVAKVRRRSKACRAGLREDDELVAIDDHICGDLSHAQAMSLIDAQRATLKLRVKRTPSGFAVHSASPRSCTRVLSPPVAPAAPHRPPVLSPTEGPRCITSPPNSEAYYGETDSDADTQTLTSRRPRRTPPHARSPCRYGNQEEEETSEMSGYESAPDGGVSLPGPWEVPTGLWDSLPGVPRREVLYLPPQSEWSTPAHTPHTLTPHTLTPHTLTPPPDQGLLEGEGEGDSGFQEAGGCVGLACPPLVSPERAKEALMLSSSTQLVPMVGPQQSPVSDELAATYKKKARQAKLQRGESLVEKQVKEARTKCRSIASLLTDAPNPNSKGVLMFKKRRQRAKKYTLTCFGKAEGDGGETEGETGGETEEEGGSSFFSGSDVDEEGFSASFDPTWDSGYLDVLDRRSSACPSTTPTTPTTPTANHNTGLDTSAFQSPGLVNSTYQSPDLEFSAYRSPELERLTCQGSRLESSGEEQPISSFPAPISSPMSPPAVSLTNGGSVGVSRATVVLSPPSQTALPAQSEQNASPIINMNPNLSSSSLVSPDFNSSQNPGNVLNRTARPFTPGPATSRLSVTPVLFRPPQPRPATITTATKPVAAVSMVTIAPPRQSAVPEARRAVSSTSLYIPPRNNNPSALSPPSILSPPPINGPTSVLSPPPPLASATFSHLPANTALYSPQPTAPHTPLTSPPVSLSSYSVPPLSPPAAQDAPLYCSPAQPFSPPLMHDQSTPPPHPPSYSATSSALSAPPLSSPPHLVQAQVYAQVPPPPTPPCPAHTQPPPTQSFNPYMKTTNPVTSVYPNAMATTALPPAPAPEPLASREQRISVPAARTGILQEARRRANKKPMFASVQNRKDVSPNPALLSALQNMDDVPGTGSGGPGGPGSGGEAGHESGPEEDWLRLGAEACNFMQAQKGPRPPPVAPKPQAPQVQLQLGGKGGQLFARRQSRMDRYTVERSPSVAAAPYSPAQTREPSPTPSLPAAWKYSSNIRAPPPISYNPLLSPSCPLKAQKAPKAEVARSGLGGSKAGKKGGMKPLEIMTHQPYQLNSSLFSYGGGSPKNPSTYQQQGGLLNGPRGPAKTARVYEVKRFSTPPPTNTGPSLKVIAPRSATTLGEPLCRSDITCHPHIPPPAAFQTYEPPAQWVTGPLSPPPPPAPTTPLPQLPTLSNAAIPYKPPPPVPTFTHLQATNTAQANKQFKSAPDLSPVSPTGASQSASSSSQFCRVPRPRFSTSNLGLQPGVWRPGSTMH